MVQIAIQTKCGKASIVVHLQRNGATVTACTTQTRGKVAWFPEIVSQMKRFPGGHTGKVASGQTACQIHGAKPNGTTVLFGQAMHLDGDATVWCQALDQLLLSLDTGAGFDLVSLAQSALFKRTGNADTL